MLSLVDVPLVGVRRDRAVVPRVARAVVVVVRVAGVTGRVAVRVALIGVDFDRQLSAVSGRRRCRRRCRRHHPVWPWSVLVWSGFATAGQLSPGSGDTVGVAVCHRRRRCRRRRHPAGPGWRRGAVVLALVTEDIPVHVRLDLRLQQQRGRDDAVPTGRRRAIDQQAPLTAQAVTRGRGESGNRVVQHVKADPVTRSDRQPLGERRDPSRQGVRRARPGTGQHHRQARPHHPQPIPANTGIGGLHAPTNHHP